MSVRSRTRIDPLGAAAVLLLVGTVAASWFLVRPLLGHKPAGGSPQAARPRDPEGAKVKFESSLDRHLAMIEGRSLFAIPPEPALVKDEGPKATVYAGPLLIAYINGAAYFSDGQKVSPSQPKARTLELIRASPPWNVRVKWEGGEFDVDLFKRVPIGTLNEPLKAWSSKQAIPNPPSPPSPSAAAAQAQPTKPGQDPAPTLGTGAASAPAAPAGSPGLAPASSPAPPPPPPAEPVYSTPAQDPAYPVEPPTTDPATEPKDPPQEPSANT